MLALQLKNVFKTFRGKSQVVSVLRNLNLEIAQGEFVAIIGGSGEGKTTLLNILGCLDRPDSGQFYLQEEPINWDAPQALAQIRGQKIATIFQNFELISHWNVLENVEMCMQFQGVNKQERNTRALQALRQVGLLQHSAKFPHELSGGEQQRCAIARAICANPHVLLADEPTGNLDPQNAQKIMELLFAMHRQGKTVIFVTHDHQLARLAQRVAILRAGQIEWWSDAHVQN